MADSSFKEEGWRQTTRSLSIVRPVAQIYYAGRLRFFRSQAVTDIDKTRYYGGERYLPTSSVGSPDAVNYNCRLAVYDTYKFTA